MLSFHVKFENLVPVMSGGQKNLNPAIVHVIMAGEQKNPDLAIFDFGMVEE